MVNKLVIFCVVLTLMCMALMLYGDDITLLKPYYLSGSGSINSSWDGSVYLQIDSTGADTSGVRFYTEAINTARIGLAVVQGFFAWYTSGPSTIDGDSAFPADTMVVKLQTGWLGPTGGYAFRLRTDTLGAFDTLYYEITDTDDTLLKSSVWFEVDIWDSTSDAVNARPSTATYLRNYNIKAGLEAR